MARGRPAMEDVGHHVRCNGWQWWNSPAPVVMPKADLPRFTPSEARWRQRCLAPQREGGQALKA